MARVTIEDCLKRIDNAYDIVSLASQRAKDILDGSEPKIDSVSYTHLTLPTTSSV